MNPNHSLLVVGSSGQVAQCLAERARERGVTLTCLGRPDLDILDVFSVRHALAALRPALIINASAYTAVDQAESDVAAAFALNADAPGRLAALAAEQDCPIIHISTDYVFDGTKQAPYTEADMPAPVGAYGRSKLAGEDAVREANPHHVILRTAWVYSPFGKNFVKTMLRVASTNARLRVVHDQIGNPTSAHDIADAILDIAATILEGRKTVRWGTFHMTSTGEASWAEFAEFIFEVSRTAGGPVAEVDRIDTSQYPTPTLRPANSRLDCGALQAAFGVTLPHWQVSAQACIWRLISENRWDI